MKLNQGIFIIITSSLLSCVSNIKEFSDDVSIDPMVEQVGNIKTKEIADRSKYQFKDQGYTVEWVGCIGKEDNPTFILANDKSHIVVKGHFCKGGLAQIFLKHGFNVIGINLPGVANSSGESDFGGPQSRTAIKSAVTHFSKQTKSGIEGIWGYYSASIAASFYAKKSKNIRWLILGGGIYDAEAIHKEAKHSKLKNALDKVITPPQRRCL